MSGLSHRHTKAVSEGMFSFSSTPSRVCADDVPPRVRMHLFACVCVCVCVCMCVCVSAHTPNAQAN